MSFSAMPSAYILLILAIVVALYSISIFNRLVKNRNLVAEGWSGIDVQLKRRYDLIPMLVETVRGYSRHEQQVFEDVAKLRTQGEATSDIEARGAVEGALSQQVKSLFALVESYPDLKADKNFLQLQSDLTIIEDQIQYARRYYNGTVRNLNILIESFPSNILASMCKFERAKFFELEYATERKAPEVKV